MMRAVGMMVAVGVLVAARGSVIPPCRSNATNAGRFYLEAAPAVSRDTLRMRVCLLPARGTRAASYHAELSYDSTRVRAVRVDAAGGLHAANVAPPGRVALAGVAIAGFEPGLLATVVMQIVSPGAPGAMDLRLLELTDASGRNMANTVALAGFPSASAQPEVRRAPHIDSLTPRRGEISAEDVTEVTVYGRGFTTDNNQVYFGRQKVGVVPSEAEGTRTRFHVPTMIPGRRGQLPVRIAPGRYVVRLKNANGASNSATFTVLPSRS